MMDDIGTLDKQMFRYQSPPYAEIASIEGRYGDLEKFWGSDNAFLAQIRKTINQQVSISAWTDEGETDPKILEEPIEREKVRNSIKERIFTLKRLGDEEGIASSDKSAKFLIDFFNKRMIKNEPFIFLLENGNFRALWENKSGEQIGLQFLPDKNIQFVIFANRPDKEGLARSFGSDTPEGINRQVEINKIRSLFYS